MRGIMRESEREREGRESERMRSLNAVSYIRIIN